MYNMYNILCIYIYILFFYNQTSAINWMPQSWAPAKNMYFNYQRPIKHIGNEFHWKVQTASLVTHCTSG